MTIGYIGLGRMGKNMVLHLLEQDVSVVAWNRSKEPGQEIKNNEERIKNHGTFESAESIQSLVNKLEAPRIIWLMLPAGEVTDAILDELLPFLSKDDLVIDGANSYYKDTIKRGKKLSTKGIHFMDIGVSGGPGGARSGATLMIGGELEDFERIKPLVLKIAAPDAYAYFGKLGSGHFAKTVHNGMEYGMMEAIAEGAAVLKSSEYAYKMADVFKLYNNRSVIESRLVGWAEEAFREDEELSDLSSKIGISGGEAEWTIKAAQEKDITVPVIADALTVRQQSGTIDEESLNGFRNKVVSAIRGKFGQHKVKK